MNVNDIEKLIAITKPVVKTISKGVVVCYKNRAIAGQAISKFNEFPKLMLDPRKPILSAFDFAFTLLFLAMIVFGILNVSVSGIMLISVGPQLIAKSPLVNTALLTFAIILLAVSNQWLLKMTAKGIMVCKRGWTSLHSRQKRSVLFVVVFLVAVMFVIIGQGL